MENGGKLKDSDAIRIIELLIDKYHFQDQQMDQEHPLIVNGVNYIEKSITEDMNEIGNEKIVRILGVIRFVARRRTKIGREYMTIIHQYVGPRIASGVRVLLR
ncbi:MAG: hypothetical protein B6I22_05245 [Desulfobacteraceae bacterium 4572_123]|nr:MAG: hypothetical protein B6I22_05245 [Desulfobacteraceae bacterium 4572_123]